MKRPTLEDFDVSERVKGNRRIAHTICMFVVVGLSILILNQSVSISKRLAIDPLVAIIIGIAMSWAPILIVDRILELIFPSFRRLRSFERALGEWAKLQREFWLNLSPRDFEKEVAHVFSRVGYRAEVTPFSNDKGVDIWLSRGNERIAVQCKAHNKAIGPSVAREMLGTAKSLSATSSMIVSRSGFTKGVFQFAAERDMRLISLDDLLAIQQKAPLS